MSRVKKQDVIIPALLAGAAAYFGFTGRGDHLRDLTHDAVTRVLNDPPDTAEKKPAKPAAAKPKAKPKKKPTNNRQQKPQK
jgi:hypothetical protein